MSGASTVHKINYAVGILLSLLVWTIACGLVAKYEGYFIWGSLNAGKAVLAWGLISWVYYIAALVVFLFVSSSNPFVSIIADVTIMGFLWLFGIVSVGCLSDAGGWFRGANYGNIGSVGQATLAFGWLLVFLQLGTLVYEVVYTLVHHGGDLDTWRQSFADVTGYGGGHSEKRLSFGRRNGGGGGTVPAVQTA